jgi:RNA polymerase sigma-70 factor (ECF subfamily)
LDVTDFNAERLQALIDAHGAALVLYARQWCNAPEDALQEALIELLRQDPEPDRPVAWLFKTVRRRAMNLARGERRRVEHHRQAGRLRDPWFVVDTDLDLDTERLAATLEQLPPVEREIVVARTWGELSFEQIAELVGLSTSSAHRRYRRALAMLGSMLNGKPESSGKNHEPRASLSNRSES